MKYQEDLYNLISYTIPEDQNYVVLESLNSIKENQYPLSIHVLMFTDNESYILGRGHESDVRINDISVSRAHMKLVFRDNQFAIEDCGSKFGTLILSKNDILIDEERSKLIQVGRTLTNVSIVNSQPVSASTNTFNLEKIGEEISKAYLEIDKEKEAEKKEDI